MFFLLSALQVVLIQVARADSSFYLEELKAQATVLRLSDHPTWLHSLYIFPGLWNPTRSMVPEASFFLPQAESRMMSSSIP